jgi:hypothetical protein
MANFNLLAEINLQLAQGAAAKLATDINKALDGLNVNPKIKPTLVLDGEMARIFPGGTKLTKIRVGFDISKTQKNALKDLLKSAKIKVQFDFDSKSVAGMKIFTDSIKQLRTELDALGPGAAAKFMENLSKVKKTMADMIPEKLAEKRKNAQKKDAEFFTEYIKRARELKNLNIRSVDGGTIGQGEFIGFLNDQLDEVIANYKTAGKQSINTAKQFQGTSVNAAGNAKKAFQEVFKTVKQLNQAIRDANNGSLTDTDKNDLLDKFRSARVAATDLLKTLETTDPVALKTRLEEIQHTFRSQINDLKQYKRLLRGLEQESANAFSTGADPATVKALDDRVQLVKDLRNQGKTTGQIRDSIGFTVSEAQIKNIMQLDKSLKQLRSRAEKLQTETGIASLFDSVGGQAINLRGQVNALLSDFNTFITATASTNAPEATNEMTNAYNKLGIQIVELKNNAKQLDIILKGLANKESYYNGADMKVAAEATRVLTADITALISRSAGLSHITAFWEKQNQEIENLAQNEQKIKRYIYAIDRLRSSMQFGIDGIETDYAGVQPLLDSVEKRFLSNLTSSGVNSFNERDARKTLSEESYRIRAKQKINQFIQDAIDKFDYQIFENGGTAYQGIGQVFEEQKKRFVSFTQAMQSGGELTSNSFRDMQAALTKLEKGFRVTFDTATIKSAGGAVGVVAHAIGLAAKRLSAFVVAALPVYALQNAFFGLSSAAVELDSQFIKLQQIFSGDSLETARQRTDELANSVLKLGSTYGVSSLEIAKSADILAQANIRGNDLDKILGTVTKARLGPTFGDASQITEAVIASLNQFELEAKDVEDVIGGINQVAAKYAVEADGITKAIRRAGGAFAAAKADGQSYNQAISEFVGAFTVLKQETREADETLATSLRNILNRIQRGSIQKYLREQFDIQLLSPEKQFIGFLPAINQITDAIERLQLKSGDPRFAALVQKIAGSLQASRLTSLLQDAGQIQEAVQSFQGGGKSLDRDVNIAFGSITNKIERAKNAILELFTEFSRSDTLKQMIDLFTLLTQSLTKAVGKIVDVTNEFGNFGTVALTTASALSILKIASSYNFSGKLLQPFLRGLVPREVGNNFKAPGLSTGGLVPGAPIGPNIDTEPYMLSKGEYVVNRYAVLKYGKKFFNDVNSGKLGYAATGSGPNGMISKAVSFTAEKLGITKLFNIIADTIKSSVADLSQSIQSSAIYDITSTIQDSGSSSDIKNVVGKLLENNGLPNIVADIKSAGALQDKKNADAAVFEKVLQSIHTNTKTNPLSDLERLPNAQMEDVISGYLSGPAPQAPTPSGKPFIGTSFRGNNKLLQQTFSDYGLNIPDNVFTQLFKGGFGIDESSAARGKFNTNSKSLILRSASDVFNKGLITHEAGHGLDPLLTSGKINNATKLLYSGDFADKTRQRLLKRPDLYGAEGSKKFNDKLQKEVRADIVKELAAKGRGEGTQFSDHTEKTLDAIKNILEKDYKITFTQGRKNSVAAEELSGMIEPLLTRTVAESQIGMRLPAALRQTEPDYTNPAIIEALQNTIGKESPINSGLSEATMRKFFESTASSSPATTAKEAVVEAAKEALAPGFGGGGFFDKYGKGATGAGAASAAGGVAAATGVVGKGISKVSGLLSKFGLSLSSVAIVATTTLVPLITSMAGSSENVAKSFATLANVIGSMTAAVATYTTIQYGLNKIKTLEGFQSIAGSLKGGVGKVTGYLTGLRGGAKGLVGATARGIGGGVGRFATFMENGSKAFSLLSIGVVAATAGLKAFNESLIASSQEIIDKSTSEAQVREELAKQQKLKSSSRSLGATGKVAAGAGLGSVVLPGIGTAIGAGLGAVYALFTDLADSNLVKGLSKLAGSVLPSMESVVSVTGAIFSSILDSVSTFFSYVDSAIGYVAGIDPEKDLTTKKNRKDIENLAFSNANLNALELANKNKVPVSVSSDKLLRSLSLLNTVKNEGSTDKDTREQVKAQATRLKAAIDVATPFERAEIYKKAKDAGIDLAKFFGDLDIDFNRVEQTSAIALAAINEVFLGMAETAKRLTSVVDNINASTEYFNNLAAGMAGEGNSGAIPSQFFDIMRSGNNIVGPGTLDVERAFSNFAQFNPQAAANARAEYFVNQASRSLVGSIASDKIQVTQQGGYAGLKDSLAATFDQLTANLPDDMAANLNDMFMTYLDSQEEELAAVTGQGFDKQKVAGIVEGFAQQFNNGSIDLFQKFSESNSQFKQALDGITKRRLEYESRITDIVKTIGERRKAQIEFNNKARGLNDTDITRSQAASIDAQYISSLVGGNGNVSARELRAAYGQYSAMDPTGSNPEIQAIKENIMKALEYMSSGTNSFSSAMSAFDKAAEKAKRSADSLTDSLLGTDEALLSSFRGQLAYQQVVGAKNGGGMLALNQLSEQERASLSAFIGQDEERKLAFQKAVGISPTVKNRKEANAVNAEFDKQNEASNALIDINRTAANNMNALAQTMAANNLALSTLGNQINQFATAANSMAQSLVNIPQNITHTHTFNVSPIQVVFSGANNITGLNDATEKAVLSIVQTQLNQFATNLQSNNKGLVVGPQPSQQSQGRRGR